METLTKPVLQHVGPSLYISSCGLTLQREYNTSIPDGRPVAGRWVLRDAQGVFVDFDHYINDLAERNKLDFEYSLDYTGY
jgi:hypothetical protein